MFNRPPYSTTHDPKQPQTTPNDDDALLCACATNHHSKPRARANTKTNHAPVERTSRACAGVSNRPNSTRRPTTHDSRLTTRRHPPPAVRRVCVRFGIRSRRETRANPFEVRPSATDTHARARRSTQSTTHRRRIASTTQRIDDARITHRAPPRIEATTHRTHRSAAIAAIAPFDRVTRLTNRPRARRRSSRARTRDARRALGVRALSTAVHARGDETRARTWWW